MIAWLFGGSLVLDVDILGILKARNYRNDVLTRNVAALIGISQRSSRADHGKINRPAQCGSTEPALGAKKMNPSKPPVSLSHPELIGMSGGQKAMWLRLHRQEIIDFYGKHGEKATMVEYRINKYHRYVLDALLPRNPIGLEFTLGFQIAPEDDSTDLKKALDLAEKAIRLAQQSNARVAEVAGQVRELREQFAKFVESTSTQISKALIIPLLRSVVQFEGNLPQEADNLNLDSLLHQARQLTNAHKP